MFYLVYVSAAVNWFSQHDLHNLLAGSRTRNARAGITGMLLYKDGNFMQALEGDEPAVWTLLERIRRDPRHQGLVVLCNGQTDGRQFPDWSMGFCNLGEPEDTLPEGYTPFLDLPLTDPVFQQSPGRAWDLLTVFKKLD